MNNLQIQFSDKVVSYDTFLTDLASRVVQMIKEDKDDPEYISQRQAFKMFGKGNVLRWDGKGFLTTRKRPGKIEYQMTELRRQQRIEQDYF